MSGPETGPPVFIVGAGHSGTTILYRMLALHPETAWFSQYSLRNGAIPGRRRLPMAGSLEKTLRRTASQTWQKGRAGGLRGFVTVPKEAPEIWNHIFPSGEPSPSPAARARLSGAVSAVCATQGRPRFVGKWIRLYKHLQDVRASFPGSLVVVTVRDPYAVALSHRHKDRKLEASEPSEVLLRAVSRWREVLDSVQGLPGGGGVLRVDYEALCGDVHGQIERILSAAELPSTSFPFGACPTTLRVTNAKWLDKAPKEEQEIIARALEGNPHRVSGTSS